MFGFGPALIFCTILVIDFIDYREGANALFFKDKTEIEKTRREIQLLELKQRLYALRSYEQEITDENISM